MKRHIYPFSAIVGQESMKTALVLNAVDPSIGGVLISGHKGTAKSTAVRALAQILPRIEVVAGCPYHCSPSDPENMDEDCLARLQAGEKLETAFRPMPVVELPLSATEDRLVGALHVEHALKTGTRKFEPGLLATANRGILYVDEVNLLDDHLVDMLLDAAASGVNVVEREGISYVHPARFMLIGTMNPEEGDLRPQFLDRFGLNVTVTGLTNVKERQDVIRQRLEFEKDPDRFQKKWQPVEDLLAGQILYARTHLSKIEIPDDLLEMAVRLAVEVDVHGHRADIAILKTARALAALTERRQVQHGHLAEAARYVLPHRIQNASLSASIQLMEKINSAIKRILKDAPSSTLDEETEEKDEENIFEIDRDIPGAMGAGYTNSLFSFLKKKEEKTHDPDEGVIVDEIDLDEIKANGGGCGGKRQRNMTEARTGRYVRSAPVRKGENGFGVAVDATMRAAMLRQAQEGNNGKFCVEAGDLRKKVRKRPQNALVVFAVDASDSMGGGTIVRMRAAKGAALALLSKSCQKRDRIAVVAFRDESAQVLLRPTSSVTLARERLQRLPTGGATPFADGLMKSWQLIKAERAKDPDLNPLLVVISDGEANVPIQQGCKVMDELLALAGHIRQDGIASVAIDTKPHAQSSDEMKQIAGALGARYHHMSRLLAKDVLELVQTTPE